MSVLAYIAITLCVILVWLYLRWRRVRNYWADRGIPYLPPHPILGSLTFLQQVNASVWFRIIYPEFKSPYAGLWFFWKPALMINCPELARQVLVKDSAYFRNRHVSSGSNDPLGALNLFTVNDPEWSNIRRRLSSTFTAAKLRCLQDFIQRKCRELVTRIEMERNNRIDTRSMLADFTTDVVGTSAFGVASDATLTGEGPLRTITKELMKYSIYRGICLFSIFFWPELVNPLGFTFFPKVTTDYFRKIFKTIATQRRTDKDHREYKDLFDSLLQIQKESAEEGKAYSEEFMIAQALILLQGGFDTTAVMLTYITLELAFHQDIQEKLYMELLEAKTQNGSDAFDTSLLMELPYLKCVIKEALRRYPGMGWIDRVAACDYKIDDHLTIAAGTPIAVNIIGMHHDPKYYPDPFKFDPDRFLPENEKNRKAYAYCPFGDGPRICIGKRFAEMTMVQAIASICLNYKILPYPDTPNPLEAKAEAKGMFYMPGESIRLNYVPRREL